MNNHDEEPEELSDREQERPRTKADWQAKTDRQNGLPPRRGRKGSRISLSAGYQCKMNAAILGKDK